MKKFTTTISIILLVASFTACATPSPKVKDPLKERDLNVSSLSTPMSEIDAFLQEYDDVTIDEEKTEALLHHSTNKNISKGLPPKNDDLFASGLYMPFEDSSHIYHDYDHVYFKVVNGSWNLDAVKNKNKKQGYIFTKEKGLSK